MPYKSEKIKIAGTKYDRRVKLTPEQKEHIRWLRDEEHLSYRTLAKMFNVSKRLIQFVIKPEIAEKCREQLMERKRSGKYKPLKEAWAETVREHRQYKQKLKLEGKI